MKGVTGMKGATGAQGIQGIQGVKGATGKGSASTMYFNSKDNISTGDFLLPYGRENTEFRAQYAMPDTVTATSMVVVLQNAPGLAIDGYKFTVRKNTINTGLTIDVKGATTKATVFSNVPFSRYDLISVQINKINTPNSSAAIVTITF